MGVVYAAPVLHASVAKYAGMIGTDLFEIPLTRIDGRVETLATYRGKAILVVNVASACGLTPQYEALQSLYESYGQDKFVVLGFPCNQFGAQEPGTHEEIVTFCNTRYHVTFPMFEKIDVNGEQRHPLYRALIEATGGGEITWNFEKFLIGKDGSITRFAPRTTPQEIEEDVKRAAL